MGQAERLYHPSVEEVAQLETRSLALDDAFALFLKPCTLKLPDETRIGDLRTPPKGMEDEDRTIAHFLPDYHPPVGWEEEYHDQFTLPQRIAWSVLMRDLMTMRLDPIGEIRANTYENLRDGRVTIFRRDMYKKWAPRKVLQLTFARAAFVKIVFG